MTDTYGSAEFFPSYDDLKRENQNLHEVIATLSTSLDKATMEEKRREIARGFNDGIAVYVNSALAQFIDQLLASKP